MVWVSQVFARALHSDSTRSGRVGLTVRGPASLGDDLLLLQRADVVPRQSEFEQDLFRVLTRVGGDAPHVGRLAVELHGTAGHFEGAVRRMGVVDEVSIGDHLGIVANFPVSAPAREW